MFSTSCGSLNTCAATLAAAKIAIGELEFFWRYWLLYVSGETPSGKIQDTLSDTIVLTELCGDCERGETKRGCVRNIQTGRRKMYLWT